MKEYFLLFLLALVATAGVAQNDVGFTQFNWNKMAYNPAYAGANRVLDVAAVYRNQWAGIEGAPSSLNAAANGAFLDNRLGLGLNLQNDRIGMTETQQVALNYAYKFSLNEKTKLSIGLSTALERYETDWSQSRPDQAGDVALPGFAATATRPNFGAGAYLFSENYFIGVSMPRLLSNRTDLTNALETNAGGNPQTLFLMAGYVLPLSEQVDFRPTVLLTHNPAAPFDVDVNLNFLFAKTLWVGANYRWNDSLAGVIQYEFDRRIRLGLSYDFTLSELSKATSGSFEVMVGYTFECADCRVENLRYF